MLEKVFENKIKKLLKEKSAYYVKFFGCGITTAGTPDILACVNGHFLGIECKADNGRLSELQRLKLKTIQSSGGIGIVAAAKTEIKDNSEQWRHWNCSGSVFLV